jgi:hypothetical protein
MRAERAVLGRRGSPAVPDAVNPQGPGAAPAASPARGTNLDARPGRRGCAGRRLTACAGDPTLEGASVDEEAELRPWVRIAAAWLVATTPLVLRAQPSLQCTPVVHAAPRACCAGKICTCGPKASCHPRPASAPAPILPSGEIPSSSGLQGLHLAALLHPIQLAAVAGRLDNLRPVCDSRIATRHSETMLTLFCTLVV